MNINETVALYLNNGNQLLEEGNLEEAIAAYRRAIELNPDLSWSHHNLGEALAKLGKLEEAIAAFRRAIELNPDFSWSYHHLGDALDRQQQWEKAVVAFRRAIELNPEHFGSYVGLGQSLAKLGQLDEAIAAYRRASELNPEADWIQYRLGDVLQQRTQLDLEGAIVSYRRAIELNPDDVQAYRKLLQIDPDNLEFLLQLGKALVKQEQWEDAIASYRRALELNPDDVQAYRNLLEIQPDNVEVWLQLGKTLVKLEQWEDAINYYRHITKLNPEIIEEYQKLGELLVKQGELEEAIKCWRTLTERNYNFSSQCFLNELEPINTIPINPENLVVNQITVGEIIQGISGCQLICQSGKQGLVSYGPYLNIPDGLYRVLIDCEFPELTTDDKSLEKVGFKFDIVSDGCRCSWYVNEVKIQNEKNEFFIELVDANLMEIRFFAVGTTFCINSIRFNLLYNPTPSYYQDIGRFLQKQGKIKKAITAYKKSYLKLSNNNGDNFHSSLGEYLIQQGNLEAASAVYYDLGEKLIANTKIVEAITAYNLALKIQPNWQEIREKIAQLQEQLDHISTKIEALQKYLETNPTSPETWFKLGELYENISNELAIQSYQKTLDIDISWSEAYVRIRKIRREMGIFQRDVSREPVADSELVLSVVVQTYNRATRLQKSLESYVKTDRSDIEFLICDNHSTDNTEELVQSFMALDKRIRYIRHYTNLGASRNGFIGFVSAKAPLVMFITDDDYMTEGFVDAVIFIFDNYPTVGAVLNLSQNPGRLAAYSNNLRGGELHKKGKETVLSAALLSGQLCGSTYRRETVNYRLWNVNDSMIAAIWLSSDLAIRHDIYVLFLKTEYPIINAYITIPTEDRQIGASSMLYRTKNGFLNWDVGAAEMVDFPLYLINMLGLSSPEKWHFYHGRVFGLFQFWLWAHFRLWYPEDVEGAFVFLSRVLRHPYIRFSLLFWQIMIRESLSPAVNVTVQDRVTIIMLGCFMLIWRLIIYLRDFIDPGLADIYYTGAWPRKDTIQLTHSQAELEIESSRDIGYSALTVVHDLQYELDNM